MHAQFFDNISAKVIKRSYQISFIDNWPVAELILKGEVVLDPAMAKDIKKVIETRLPGRKCFLLVGSEGYMRVTKKARKLGADKEFSSHLAAVACYSSNISLTLLGELFIKINKPAVSTKVYYSREPALEWLMQKLFNASDSNDQTAFNTGLSGTFTV